jgi:hypothetical protein
VAGYIVVSRPNVKTGRLVRHKVYIDGRMVGKIRANASLTVPVPPGDHRVKTSAGRSPSKEGTVTVGDDAFVYLESVPDKKAASIMGALAFVTVFIPGITTHTMTPRVIAVVVFAVVTTALSRIPGLTLGLFEVGYVPGHSEVRYRPGRAEIGYQPGYAAPQPWLVDTEPQVAVRDRVPPTG